MKQIQANSKNTLVLGRQGENLARQVVFDLSDWMSEYGQGLAELIAQRPGDTAPYPAAAVQEGRTLVWTLTAADVERPRGGCCELRYYVGEALVKSRIWQTYVEPAMDTPAGEAPPVPEQAWFEQVLTAGDGAKASAEAAADAQAKAENARQSAENARDRAETAAIRQPYPSAGTGTWWVWDADTASYADSGAPIADQPRVVRVTGAELTLTLANNTETRCADPVTSLTIQGFAAGDEGRAEQWGLVFTASAEGITVTVPDTLIWAVAEPVFTAGSTYWLSVVPLGGKYLAAWTEVPDES